MKFNYTFELNDEHMSELEMLHKAMQKAHGDDYTIEKTFDFVMQLSSEHRIFDAIENAAYHYDKYYDEYPYEYGNDRSQKMLKIEKKTGEYQDLSYPNPTIKRNKY